MNGMISNRMTYRDQATAIMIKGRKKKLLISRSIPLTLDGVGLH